MKSSSQKTHSGSKAQGYDNLEKQVEKTDLIFNAILNIGIFKLELDTFCNNSVSCSMSVLLDNVEICFTIISSSLLLLPLRVGTVSKQCCGEPH